jgi:hypothetical protein
MKDKSRMLSIVAYYLSKYDLEAVEQLGFKNRTDAFKKISMGFDRDNNYLKIRRDEFDVISGSHRNGWRNRVPTKDVIEIAEHMNKFSFQEITDLVLTFITKDKFEETEVQNGDVFSSNSIPLSLSEEEVEFLINSHDTTAGIVFQEGLKVKRIYNQSIIVQLKKLYNFRCQLCGCAFIEEYGVDYAEAHHIEYFTKSKNNNVNNILILCPNHHRIIHKLNPKFDYEHLEYVFSNGKIEKVLLNFHL